MSSWASIEIDGMKIDETQNHFDEWYFNKKNRVIKTVFCTDYYGDPMWEPKEEQIKIYQYRIPAGVLRRRLNLAGYNLENLEREFKQQLNQQIKDAEDMIELVPDGDAARFLPVLKKSTLAEWIERLRIIHERKLDASYFDSEKVEYDDELLTFMLRVEVFYSSNPTAGYFSFPCLTKEGYATALLEIFPDSVECVQDVTELIHAGWSEEFEDLEEYQQEFTKFYEVFQTAISDTTALMELDRKKRCTSTNSLCKCCNGHGNIFS
ncbi:HEPN/Toprim-associated domain-containing protein [Massilia sp. NP310]|uniref:HEPN/Toprim-associated domain-containing protein n=1 Tax=Massilia sp. NP310 TaxID=2861282 RepID=UPI0022772839|nr:HEPN/Toprim-associated domain-containing protein [Massilia sp. NP310]